MTKKSKIIDYDNTFYLSKRIYKNYIIPNLPKFLVAILLMLVVAGTTTLLAYLVKPALDDVFDKKDVTKLVLIPIVIMIVTIVKAAATYLQSFIMNIINMKISIKMQNELYKHFLHSDINLFNRKSSGNMIVHMTSDIGNVLGAMNLLLTGIIREVITIVSLVGLMLYQSITLSIIALIGMPALFYPIRRLGKKLRKLSAKAQENSSEFTTLMTESLGSIRIVKAYTSEDFEANRMKNTLDKIFKLNIRMIRSSLISSPLVEMFGGIGVAGVIWYGGMQIIDGATTQGAFFSFMTALGMAYKPFKSLSGINIKLQSALTSAKRLFVVMDAKPKVKDRDNAIELKNVKGDIEFKDVLFKYAVFDKNDVYSINDINADEKLSDKIALDNVSFNIKKGKTTALVGHSGSGKSTIINLILRFYDIQSGKIELDKHDIRDLTVKSLRSSMSLVSQDVVLFDGSVKDNIRYGKEGATDEEVIEAARFAAAHEFIMEMPEGYETNIGRNGIFLSGGQRQRISIARAILRNAPILLLDEATSSLDPISEKLIQESLDKLMKNRTTIVIAHRLSTVMNADNIIVLSHGKIVEQGTHSELMNKKGGEYASLYQKQFQIDEERTIKKNGKKKK